MRTVTALIREELERQNLNPFRAAMRANLPENAIRTVLSGREPRAGRLAEICEALGLEFYIGPPRGVPARPAEAANGQDATTTVPSLPAPRLREVESSVRTLVQFVTDAGGNPLPAVPATSELADNGALAHLGVSAETRDTLAARAVTVWDVASAAGWGALFDTEHAVGRLSFRRAWLDRHAIDATQAAVISVAGESMEPTLPDGSVILVDRARRRRRVGRVFVVRAEDGLLVKRAGKDRDGRWQLRSDNPTWHPVPWSADAEVVGEVRWMARTLG